MIISQQTQYTLRTWQTDDIPSLAENANNINIWNNVRDYFPHPYTQKDAEEFISFVLQKPNTEDFVIEVNNKAVGGIGFVPQHDVERLNAEIGYWLSEKHWHKGIMHNAVKDAIEYIFANTEIIRLFATVYEYNKESMRVLEKVGFQKLTVLSKAAIKNGRLIDMHYYELLAH